MEEDVGFAQAGCVDLLVNITRLLSDIQQSTSSPRHVEQEMNDIPSQLDSLHLSVRAIATSCSRSRSMPISLKNNLRSILTGCNHVVTQLRDLLRKSTAPETSAASIWAGDTAQSMNALLTSLEAHKSAIEIALELMLISAEGGPTECASRSGPEQDLQPDQKIDQIFFMLREIQILRVQVQQLARTQPSSSTSLHRFLEDVSEYAESVYQESDGNSLRIQTIQAGDEESEPDDFYSVKESFTDSARPSTNTEREATDTFELTPQNPPHHVQDMTQYQPGMPSALLPSSSSLSQHSAWSYASIRLRISNRLYSFKTADDTARNVMSAISFLGPAVHAVRLARQQGIVLLSDAQKTWIDQQIAFAEQSMDRAALLIEPARIDLQKRARVRFVRKISFVLRDSPRIQACFEQLSVAGAGLNVAANLLYGDGSHLQNGFGEADSISGMSIPAPPYSLSWREAMYQ